ncbi:MAG: hypothetical protein CME62_03960 [Halobacteriovoraceae bacterium]|nr:hypothetical protein [Halobacteriovoraceae bacterium]|tara:strand:+ start:15524 stop:16579 length:1056 start_codon:yes stop_codon:yes gene_type:complete
MKRLLGDPHNFGKKTYEEEGLIYKFRPLYGEYLLFARDSRFRKHLDHLFEDLPFPLIDCSRPNLTYSTCIQLMEKISVKSLPAKLSLSQIKSLGRALGVIQWLGVADLSDENIICGLSQNDQFIFAPIDLELIFSNVNTLISYSVLFPKHEHKLERIFGLRSLQQQLLQLDEKEVTELLESQMTTLQKLNDQHVKLCQFIEADIGPLQNIVIRVIMRDTFDYSNKIDIDKWHPEELVQYNRGDIPIFYKKLGANEVFYLGENDEVIYVKDKGFYENLQLSIIENSKWIPNYDVVTIFFIESLLPLIFPSSKDLKLELNGNIFILVKRGILFCYLNNKLFKRKLNYENFKES